LAAEKNLRSIAFPAISTGAFGFPHERAAPIVSDTIQSFLNQKTSLERIVLVFFEANDATVFLKHQQFAAY
jgi:O-acetyl-ADP-ribose deacetylase